MKKQAKQQRMSQSQFNEIVVNASNRMAKAQNKSFNFYDDEKLNEYFADYVRLIEKNKSLSTSQCIGILNDDLKRSLTSNVLKSKDRNIKQSYLVLQDVIANAEIAIKKKYGADNFYDLEFSKDEQAREEFRRLNDFAISKQHQFEEIFGKSTEDMIKITNVNELASQSIVCLGLATILGGAISGYVGGVYLLDEEPLEAPLGYVTIIGIGCGLGAGIDTMNYDIDVEKYTNKLNSVLKEYGFNNVDELRQYASTTVYSYLNPEEVKQLNRELLLQKLDVVADKNGFGSAEEMLDDLKNNSSAKSISSSDRLEMLASEKDVTNLNFARENGFTSYDDVLTYLNNHKILVGETGKRGFGYAGWSEYDYDSASAKILAQKLSNLDEIYDAKKQAILNDGAYSKTLVYDNQDLANEVFSYENIINSANAQIAEGGIYSINEKLSFASNELLPYWGSYEKPWWKAFWTSGEPEKGDLLKDGVNYDDLMQAIKGEDKSSILSDKIEDIAKNATDISEQVSDFAIGTGTMAGVAVGAGVSLTAKSAPQIISAIKHKKAQNTSEKIKEIDKQREQ